MQSEKQKLLLEYLVSSPDVYALCLGIVKPQYFNPEFRNAVKFIEQYYKDYSTVPSPEQILAETDVKLTKHTLTRDQLDYCATEIETFCRDCAIEEAIFASPTYLEKGDYGKIRSLISDALLVALHRNAGVDFTEDASYLTTVFESYKPYPTLWTEFDEILEGGLNRQELLIVAGNSGAGKSVVLTNLAVRYAEQGLKVLYITLELGVPVVYKRTTSIATGIPSFQMMTRMTEAMEKIRQMKDKLRLVIEKMPSATKPSHIRSFLKEFELKRGYVPDVLIVDYLDLMSPDEHVNAGDFFTKDKHASEELREILVDYDMIGVTASQLNRESVKATTHDHSHIAGGISKINTTDVLVTILRTEAMRAAGEIAFQFGKTRNSEGTGKVVYLTWLRTLRIENRDNGSQGLKLNMKPNPPNKDPKVNKTDNPTKQIQLLDMFGDKEKK